MSMVVYYNKTMRSFSARESKHALYHILNPITMDIIKEIKGDVKNQPLEDTEKI